LDFGGASQQSSEQLRNKIRTKIYEKLESLPDADLIKVLTNIGIAMSQGAEFNFYHAYTIPIESIDSIQIGAHEASLPKYYYAFNQFTPVDVFAVDQLIKQIANGNDELLLKLHNTIPNLFDSYRFVDFLLKHAKPSSVVNTFLEQRLINIDQVKRTALLQMYRGRKPSIDPILSAQTLHGEAQPLNTQKQKLSDYY